jgi:hypothetical protein
VPAPTAITRPSTGTRHQDVRHERCETSMHRSHLSFEVAVDGHRATAS